MRALLAWELGSGLGHATRLLEVARTLHARGIEIVVSGRQPIPSDFPGADLITRQLSVPPMKPIPLAEDLQPFGAAAFHDVIGLYGFGAPDRLAERVALWETIFADVQLDLIVSDFCPMLNFAAKLADIPVLAIGDGFVVPPEIDGAFPPLREAKGCGVSPEAMLAGALAISGRAGATLGEIIAGDDSVICVLPQFDLYHEVRPEPAHGPFATLPKPSPHDAEAPVLVYLDANFEPTRDLLRYLAEQRIPAIGHVRDLADHSREQLAGFGVQLSEKPIPLVETLPSVSGVIHHGGIATSQESAAAGRPQAIFPRYLEQTMNAVRLHEMKVGAIYHKSYPMSDALLAIQSPRGAEMAGQLAQTIADFQPSSQSRLEAFVDRVSLPETDRP